MRTGIAFAAMCAGCGFELGAASDGGTTVDVPGDVTHGENGQPAGPPFLRMVDITDGHVVGGPHDGFAVLLSLSQVDWLRTTMNGGRIANANGSDLWFSLDAAGTLPMPHEVERYDPRTGTLFTWVRVPSLVPTTVFFMHYGDPLHTAMPEPASVWTPGYAGVWHLGGAFSDASAQNPAGLDGGTTLVPGQLFESRSFDAQDDLVDLGSANPVDDLFAGGGTVECWFYARGWGESSYGRFFDKGHLSGWSFGLNRSDAGLLESVYFLHGVTSGTYPRWNTAANTVTLNAWHHVAVVYDKDVRTNDATIYLDGVALLVIQLGEPTASLISDAASTLYAGNRGSEDRTFNGNLDEARVSSIARSAGWIGTSYKNQREPSAFVTVGPEL